MKNNRFILMLSLCTSIFSLSSVLFAQNATNHLDSMRVKPAQQALVSEASMEKYYVPLNSSTHIISPETILYVDISSPHVEGDLQEKRICRLKPLQGMMKEGDSYTITIVTARFLISYRLIFSEQSVNGQETYIMAIDPTKTIPIRALNTLTEQDFEKLAIRALGKKRTIHNLRADAYALSLITNNIFIVGDFVLLDISVFNRSKLKFDIDEIRFKVLDKKQVKSTVSQDIDLLPIYQLYDDETTSFKRRWRNFYAFQKFTFPSDKVLSIELTEKQISGRKITLHIDYNQVLEATLLY